MEIGSYIGLAAATHGSIKIKGVKNLDMRPLKVGFAKLGISWSQEGEEIIVGSIQEMKTNADVGTKIPKIDDSPWPGFPPPRRGS